jgi:hypothetical protein
VPSPRPGEVLLRTRRTLISPGTELTILSGELITHRLAFGEAPEAYLSLLRDRSQSLAVVLEWD